MPPAQSIRVSQSAMHHKHRRADQSVHQRSTGRTETSKRSSRPVIASILGVDDLQSRHVVFRSLKSPVSMVYGPQSRTRSYRSRCPLRLSWHTKIQELLAMLVFLLLGSFLGLLAIDRCPALWVVGCLNVFGGCSTREALVSQMTLRL